MPKFILFLLCMIVVALCNQSMAVLVQGTFSSEYKILKKNNDFDDAKPPAHILENLLISSQNITVPFDKNLILKNTNFAGAFISTHWQLTTLHRLPWGESLGDKNLFSLNLAFQQSLLMSQDWDFFYSH